MQNPTPLELDFVRATFGDQKDFSGSVVHVVPPFADSPLHNAVEVRGKIAIIKRGLCTISEKARAAADAGATAVIVVNWADRVEEFASVDENNPTIPVVCVKQQDALDNLKDGVLVAFLGKNQFTHEPPLAASGDKNDDDGREKDPVISSEKTVTQPYDLFGGQFNGFLDMGDRMVLAAFDETGSADCAEEEMLPDAQRIAGILDSSYASLQDFDRAIDTFDQCMRSWQERLSILGKLGGSASVLDAHFTHLATARKLREVLSKVEECNKICEDRIVRGDYFAAVSDLKSILRQLQEAEAALRGRDELRISLLDLPQASYALLQRALIKTEQFEPALTVAVQAKARSLSHMLEIMDRTYAQETPLHVGATVRIRGLQNDLEFEGRVGTVEQVGEVVLVDVNGQEIKVRRKNLLLADDGGTALRTLPSHGALGEDQAFLQDMDCADVKNCVQEQQCHVIEYFMLTEHSVGIWLLDPGGQLQTCKVVHTQEEQDRQDRCKRGPLATVTTLLEQTRAAMGLVGRQAVPRDSSQSGQLEDLRAEAANPRDVDCLLIDHLVLMLENETLGHNADCSEQDTDLLQSIHGTPAAEKTLAQARRQCQDVRAWLRALCADSELSGCADRLETLLCAATSWHQLRSWTHETLLSQFCIQDSKVRGTVLRRISTTLDPDRLLQRLHSLLIDPIADSLPVGEEVLVIPHGVLFGVPWAALLDASGRYLVERNCIRLAPSLRVASAAATARVQRTRCPDNHVVETREVSQACVCDKCAHQWNSQRCKLSSQGGSYHYCGRCRLDMCSLWVTPLGLDQKAVIVGNPWPNSCGTLPYAEEEADRTFSVLQQAELFDAVKMATTHRATKAWTLQHLDQACWAHLACHAKLETNSLVLARTDDGCEELSLAELQNQVSFKRGSTVVLSACNTGMGQICGEGLVGLSRGALVAGAGAAVVSLWSISDESTKALMSHFYSFLLDGMDVPHALRHAMLKMLGRKPMEDSESRDAAEESCETEGTEHKLQDDEDASSLRSFTNKQGEAELLALAALCETGDQGFLLHGNPLAVGNGLDARGMMTKEACRLLFGVASYPEVWSERGPALHRAPNLGKEQLKLALLWLTAAINIRAELRSRQGSEAGHNYMLQQLKRAQTELRRQLQAFDLDAEHGLRGRTAVSFSVCNAAFSEPKFWASFVVTGARTTLPSPKPQARGANPKTEDARSSTLEAV